MIRRTRTSRFCSFPEIARLQFPRAILSCPSVPPRPSLSLSLHLYPPRCLSLERRLDLFGACVQFPRFVSRSPDAALVYVYVFSAANRSIDTNPRPPSRLFPPRYPVFLAVVVQSRAPMWLTSDADDPTSASLIVSRPSSPSRPDPALVSIPLSASIPLPLPPPDTAGFLVRVRKANKSASTWNDDALIASRKSAYFFFDVFNLLRFNWYQIDMYFSKSNFVERRG